MKSLGRQVVRINHSTDGVVHDTNEEIRVVYQDGERYCINWLGGHKDVRLEGDKFIAENAAKTIDSSSVKDVFARLGIKL